ncbi:MAG: hypothetical protein Q9191_006828 [Dirinaria sp. TL-2023a]
MGACNALASTIKKLHQLRKAPHELEALENDILALRSCAEGINQIVQMHSGARNDIISQVSIVEAIENAYKKIMQIHKYIEHSLLDTTASNKIRASAWLKWQSEFDRLRQELRDIRSEMGTCMSLFNAAESRHHEIQLEKIAYEGRTMHDTHLRTLNALQEELIQQRPALAAEMELQLRNMSQTIQANMLEINPPSTEGNARRRSSEDLPASQDDSLLHLDNARPRSQSMRSSTEFECHVETVKETPTASQGVLSPWQKPRQRFDADEGVVHPQTTEMLLRDEPRVSLHISHRDKSQCKRPCSCQCHRSSKFKTPDFLRQVTGQLLVSYAGISNITPPCNEYACAKHQKAAVRLQYHFPVWSLIQRMLTLVSYSGGMYGPEKILRMSRIRPCLDEVFIQVQSGNVRRLQQLFIQGDASPHDASDTGWTLLHYALTAGQLPTAKFLKDAGADPHAESVRRERPADVAWNRILSGSLDEYSDHLLRSVFNDDAELDERQFTTLHKIVLGMIGKNLTDELEISTAHINEVDSSGHTPLAWASARGDYRSVVVLLEYGASFDIANNVNAKPIHLAAQTGNIETVRVLVQAGAAISSAVLQTRMTPIHFAAEYQNSSEQITGLASLGALIDGKDYLSWTPLHWASWRGHLASLDALLDCGAGVNAKTLDGNASIMLAVANNSHECVQRLIEAGADCSVVRDSQWNVLHYAAIGGSIDTLRCLAKADLSGVDTREMRTKDTGQTVTDMLSARLEALSTAGENPEKRDGWKLAWDAVKVACEPRYAADLNSDLVRPLARSDTDSTYVDADDKPFEQRTEG